MRAGGGSPLRFGEVEEGPAVLQGVCPGEPAHGSRKAPLAPVRSGRCGAGEDRGQQPLFPLGFPPGSG